MFDLSFGGIRITRQSKGFPGLSLHLTQLLCTTPGVGNCAVDGIYGYQLKKADGRFLHDLVDQFRCKIASLLAAVE